MERTTKWLWLVTNEHFQPFTAENYETSDVILPNCGVPIFVNH